MFQWETPEMARKFFHKSLHSSETPLTPSLAAPPINSTEGHCLNRKKIRNNSSRPTTLTLYSLIPRSSDSSPMTPGCSFPPLNESLLPNPVRICSGNGLLHLNDTVYWGWGKSRVLLVYCSNREGVAEAGLVESTSGDALSGVSDRVSEIVLYYIYVKCRVPKKEIVINTSSTGLLAAYETFSRNVYSV